MLTMTGITRGVPAGSAQDVGDILKFAEGSGVRAVVEQLAAAQAQQVLRPGGTQRSPVPQGPRAVDIVLIRS